MIWCSGPLVWALVIWPAPGMTPLYNPNGVVFACYAKERTCRWAADAADTAFSYSGTPTVHRAKCMRQEPNK